MEFATKMQALDSIRHGIPDAYSENLSKVISDEQIEKLNWHRPNGGSSKNSMQMQREYGLKRIILDVTDPRKGTQGAFGSFNS